MEEPVFKSSALQQWFAPLLSGLWGILFFLMFWLLLGYPPAKWIDLLCLALGAYNLLFVVITWGEFNAVTVDCGGVTIQRRDSTLKCPWTAVTGFSRVTWGPLFRTPPSIYRLTIRDKQSTTYFVPAAVVPTPEYRNMAEFIDAQLNRNRGESSHAV
jgi:hypothetical protein